MDNTPMWDRSQDDILRELDRLEEGIESGRIEDTQEIQGRIEALRLIANSCIPWRLSDDEL